MTQRIPEIDILRTTSILGMIIFHCFFILNFYSIFRIDPYIGWMAILGNFVRFSFLILVGVSLAISSHSSKTLNDFYSKAFKRFLKILLAAIAVSLVTYSILPQQFIKFGILHLISLSILTLMFFADKKFSPLLIAIVSILIAEKLKIYRTDSFFLYILGISQDHFTSLDYFPIFPWISLVSLGIFLGNILYPKNKPFLQNPFFSIGKLSNFVSLTSKKSLAIYLLHVPIIILFLVLSGILPLAQIF